VIASLLGSPNYPAQVLERTGFPIAASDTPTFVARLAFSAFTTYRYPKTAYPRGQLSLVAVQRSRLLLRRLVGHLPRYKLFAPLRGLLWLAGGLVHRSTDPCPRVNPVAIGRIGNALRVFVDSIWSELRAGPPID
jgi:hypothetical protein